MTGAQVLRAGEHRRMEWANGGGTTYEVIASPDGASPGDVDWRISLADIERSGPFSTLPGIDRILVVSEGEGMDLTVDGRTTSLARLEPIAFAGESTTACTLTSGPTRDLNVMVRRGVVTATLDVVRLSDGPLTTDAHTPTVVVVVVVVLQGACQVESAGVLGLGPRDALVAPASGRWLGDATLAVVTVRHAPATP